MPSLIENLRKPALIVALVCSGLGGCMVAADTSYSEYSFGPGHQSERVYENRIYGDTQQGIGGESCRSIRRSQVDAYGREATVEESVCR